MERSPIAVLAGLASFRAERSPKVHIESAEQRQTQRLTIHH